MYDHEVYAQAFFAACIEDPVAYYRSFSEVCAVFEALPKLVDAVLFDVSRFDEVSDLFKEELPSKVYNFVSLIVQDAMVNRIQAIKKSIRNLLIQAGYWNLCIIETAQEYSKERYQQIKDIIDADSQAYVEYETRVNPSLRAGLRVFLNDRIIDLSVAGRMEKLLKELNHGQA